MSLLNFVFVGTMENRDQYKLVENVKPVTATFGGHVVFVPKASRETKEERILRNCFILALQ